jgi:hypothetical protein
MPRPVVDSAPGAAAQERIRAIAARMEWAQRPPGIIRACGPGETLSRCCEEVVSSVDARRPSPVTTCGSPALVKPSLGYASDRGTRKVLAADLRTFLRDAAVGAPAKAKRS